MPPTSPDPQPQPPAPRTYQTTPPPAAPVNRIALVSLIIGLCGAPLSFLLAATIADFNYVDPGKLAFTLFFISIFAPLVITLSLAIVAERQIRRSAKSPASYWSTRIANIAIACGVSWPIFLILFVFWKFIWQF